MGNTPQTTKPPPPSNDSTEDDLPSIRNKMMKKYFPKNCKLIRVCNDDENRMKQIERLMSYHDNYMITSKYNGILEENLPDEIIVEILQYLPMKNLIQLQMISRNFRMYWSEIPELWDKFVDYPKMMYIPMVNESMRVNFGFFHEWKQKLFESHECTTSLNFLKEYQFKALVVGDEKCGKTMYHQRVFKDAPFSDEYTKTIGVDFFLIYNNQHLQIQSWDTGGDERLRSISNSYYRGMKGHIYCFDLNSHESFENMKKIFQGWKDIYCDREDLYSYFMDCNIAFLLIGLKSDLECKVSRDEIHEFLETIEPMKDKTLHTSRVQYFELSSKQDSKADLLFPYIYSYHLIMESKY